MSAMLFSGFVSVCTGQLDEAAGKGCYQTQAGKENEDSL
jgi:hypothetical protein